MIFVDLDGVLADFDKKVVEITGKLPHEQKPNILWKALANYPNLYEVLEWMPGGKDLWEYVKQFNPIINTGLPRGRWAAPQKVKWCTKNLGDHVPVITGMSKDKHINAAIYLKRDLTVKDLLIDDRISNIDRWNEAGGRGIFHINYKNTIDSI